MKYKINLNETLEIPEYGLTFQFKAIAPEGSKYGAWPYCLSYELNGLDFFGLGTYGSNERIDDPQSVNEALNRLIDKLKDQSRSAIEISKLGSREFVPGQKYLVKFERPGLLHRGTWFESFRDIETYIKRLFEFQHFGIGCLAIVSLMGKETLGRYFVKNGESLVYEKTISD